MQNRGRGRCVCGGGGGGGAVLATTYRAMLGNPASQPASRDTEKPCHVKISTAGSGSL